MSFISWQLSREPGFLPQAQLGTGVLLTGQLWAGPRALGKVGLWIPEPAEERLALPKHPVCRAGLSWPQECQSGLRGPVPEDVRAMCPDVMRHRIGLSYEAEANNLTTEEVIAEILNKVEVP